jgi:two-component system, OmpR family, response regulator MprA
MAGADVLIVDDDADVRAMLAFALGDEFAVRFAANGTDALELLAEDPPEAMLLDVMMPTIDGYDVLELRRDRGLAPHTRVLMLTCCSAEADRTRAWALGADGHLVKPIDPAEIASKLRAVLAATPA